ncbi:Peroxin-3 [Lichtheimia hyalospora FSU 10163]|nr:Peroxin-3 [Lichtheimia hyalospora FSU 10163]
MLESLKKYTRRHRSGILVTAAIGGGSYLIGRYAAGKIRDHQQHANGKETLRRLFQQNQNDCVFTVLSLLPTLGEQIFKEINVETCWQKLQQSRKLEKQQSNKDQEGILDKETKYLLWEEIKEKSFIRTFTSIYSVTLLILLMQIQLNILGRYNRYEWSAGTRSEPTLHLQQNPSIDPQTEDVYLGACWWLLHRGWRLCYQQVKTAVDETLKSVSLKRLINYNDAQVITQRLRRRIEWENDVFASSIRSWMLPQDLDGTRELLEKTGVGDGFPRLSSIKLKALLDETKAYINSDAFSNVLHSCLDQAFAVFYRHAFAEPLVDDNQASSKKTTLANLLPGVSRQAHLVISGNEYLNEFVYSKELEAFSAIIYTQSAID